MYLTDFRLTGDGVNTSFSKLLKSLTYNVFKMFENLRVVKEAQRFNPLKQPQVEKPVLNYDKSEIYRCCIELTHPYHVHIISFFVPTTFRFKKQKK